MAVIDGQIPSDQLTITRDQRRRALNHVIAGQTMQVGRHDLPYIERNEHGCPFIGAGDVVVELAAGDLQHPAVIVAHGAVASDGFRVLHRHEEADAAHLGGPFANDSATFQTVLNGKPIQFGLLRLPALSSVVRQHHSQVDVPERRRKRFEIVKRVGLPSNGPCKPARTTARSLPALRFRICRGDYVAQQCKRFRIASQGNTTKRRPSFGQIQTSPSVSNLFWGQGESKRNVPRPKPTDPGCYRQATKTIIL